MKWYRSLYWRIAVGIVAFLAAMLVVQAMLFVWTVSRSGRTLPGQSPMRLGIAVALDLASVLERDPQTDLVRYLHEQYGQYTHPFFIMMADGRVISSGDQTVPESLLAMARARLQRPPRREGEAPFPPFGRRDRLQNPDRFPNPDRFQNPDRLERDRAILAEREITGPRFVRPVPIVVHGEMAGVVVVPPQAPFGFLLGRFAPMLAFVAAGVLVLGTVLATVLIFGPARRRLRHLESAARSLGAGDLSARAPDRGGDEIAAVASAFNAMAADLSARAEALAASDRVRRQLLADVSHELNTPVTAMRGYLETLMMPDIELDEPTRGRYLSIIGEETARLEHMIGDLLELARLEGGGGALTVTEVPVAQLFARVTARHERAALAAGVTLESSIAPDAELVSGDRDRLEQALQNLAANALRYAPRESAIRLSARRDHEAKHLRGPGSGDVRPVQQPAVVLSVEDAGPGIAPEHLPYVFDRFYKADASRRGMAGGSGLGLSIVKAIVQRHGGEISVESRPGHTVFELTIPDSAA
jgi:two-component system, OmpR family, sensor kinase